MYRHLFKYTYTQNGEYAVNAGVEAELALYNQHERVYSEGAPDLYFHCIGFATKESFDSHVHFKPFEKELYGPAGFIQSRDCERGQVEVVGEKNQEFLGFRIAVNNTAKSPRISSLGTKTSESDNLVGDDAVALRRMGMATVKLRVRFGSGNKVGTRLVDTPEAFKIDVAPIKQIETAGFKGDRVEPINVMHFPIGNVHENRQGAAQIELGVDLNSSLVGAKAGPREDRQAQVDRGRVNCVYRCIQFIDTAWVADTQFARTSDEQQRKLLEDAIVPGRIGVGQRAARNRSSEPEVIELLLSRLQAVLQVTQAFPKGEQGESEGQQMVPRRELGGLIVTAILRDDASEIPFRKKIDDLSEYKTSRMHANTLYSKLVPKRIKSMKDITILWLTFYKIQFRRHAEIAARLYRN